ncbi:unnamed protein product [Schistosoma turkestanicum]|nr:unnamed protein product [Schistosoma turkestanicum]
MSVKLSSIFIIDPTYEDVHKYAEDYDYDLRGTPISKTKSFIDYPLANLIEYYLENYSFISYLIPAILFLMNAFITTLIATIKWLRDYGNMFETLKRGSDESYLQKLKPTELKHIFPHLSKPDHQQCEEGTENLTGLDPNTNWLPKI